jgi:hypothetical protein
MEFWVPIILLIILVEIWWFGTRCVAYLSDIRDALAKMTDGDERSHVRGESSNDRLDSE